MAEALGLVEVLTYSGANVVADRMGKAAGVRLLNLGFNDCYGAIIRISGETAAVTEAVAQAREAAEAMAISFASEVYPRPEPDAQPLVMPPAVKNWLLGVYDPIYPDPTDPRVMSMDENRGALGFVETQGITACYEACDAMLKAARVEYLGLEKIGGGYVCVLVRGDVGAVKQAVEAGAAAAQTVGGKFIASHVIARPHPELAQMLPRS